MDLPLSPTQPTARLLEIFGPGGDPPPVSLDQALSYARSLASTRYENFHVLTSLVPPDLRDDFAAVYAYCRWSDDLADELGSPQRSEEALAWWRGELARSFDGHATHPVFVALLPTIQRHRLALEPFAHLLDAFVQDQRITRYDTWDQLIGYCRGSADPVGRIVLALDGLGDREDLLRMSDATCTALQLANHWQDVRRDLLERDRVYLPALDTGIDAQRLRLWADQGHDPNARVPFIRAMRPLIERTAELFRQGEPLPRSIAHQGGRLGRVVWLFGAGGRAILSRIERAGCATLWQRPRLSKLDKVCLLLRAKAWSGGKP